MKEYRVTLFGETFDITANSDYDARNQASLEYRLKQGGPEPLAYLRSKTSIKVSPKCDRRIKYPIIV